MSRAEQPRPLTPKPPKPTYEDIAERLATIDEYLWTVGERRWWGGMVILLLCGVLLASASVLYIGGRQSYVFSGYGAPSTHELRAFIKAHGDEGISLKQTAPSVPFWWGYYLTKGVWDCFHDQPCKRYLLDHQAGIWRVNALTWFPDLVLPVRMFWWSLGGLALALVPYKVATSDINGWELWEQRQRIAAGKARRQKQRRK